MNTFEPRKGARPKTKGNGAAGGDGHAAKGEAPALDHRQILSALRAFKRGDFSAKMRDDLTGIDGQIAETFNELVEMVRTIKDEATEVSHAVGKEGQAAKRMRRLDTSGGWAQYVSAVNEVITDLSGHANEIARVVTAVARGDLEQTMELEHGASGARRGEFLRHARIVNGMVARTSQFGSEVTRVALEVGGEGKLGAQARVQGAGGVWKDLTDSVNLMASNLTSQVREIARVTTAVAQGDLTTTVTIDVKGEILELKNTINTLVEQLRAFANEQEELQQTNEELEEKAVQLSDQNAKVEKKNKQVELARQELEEKAEQLALTSKYKSQFLANMSHELRTPLNSLLVLSRQLADNVEGNLTDRQIRYADTIRQAGTDLMTLINEILDLAKIESGTMAVDVAPVRFGNLREYVDQTFRQVAEEKGLGFSVELDDELPPSIETDDMRLRQVLRNLLSNAMKFTDRGRVCMRIYRAAVDVIGFAVSDTGIGVAKGKHQLIFESFQQADGSTSRKYGGTGLGLTISREIAGLLGGDLRVESTVGQGSTFTLFLPTVFIQPARETRERARTMHARAQIIELAPETAPTETIPVIKEAGPIVSPAPSTRSVPDDYRSLAPGDRVLLVIEDDVTFAMTLLEMCRASGFKGVVATSGVQALELARTVKPDGVTLDLRLPDIDGWVLLDRLKHDPSTRHIPVYVISGLDDERRSLQHGALGFMHKPVTTEDLQAGLSDLRDFVEKRVKNLLVIEDDPVQSQAITELIGDGDVHTTSVSSAEGALESLDETSYDCVVMDLRLPGMSGFELIERIKANPRHRRLPVIVYTGRELTVDDKACLHGLAQTVIIKDVRTMERLLDETALFLHRVEATLPERKQRVLRRLAKTDPQLAERHVLVVDDDVRNIFALASLLEGHKMHVQYAENGRRALAKLEESSKIDVVLMDIMMPEMDGYEALRKIRERPEWKSLPVIALTAKAMKGDREKCLEAGATDYITKPVDADQLLSLLRVWLYQA